MVSAQRPCYASPYAISRRHYQKEALQRYFESTVVIGDVGDKLSLRDTYQRSVSNPAIRRARTLANSCMEPVTMIRTS